jgi:glycosyltransferase involved in cell wall biosynthesis
MFHGKNIAVVVPAFNEERLIAKTVGTVPELVDSIVVVDDASQDATAERAREVGDPRLDLVRHERNQGVGGAILTGHRRALERGADVVVVMAGDAQMDPEYLPDLVQPIVQDGYGFTKATRFFSPSSFANMPRTRLVGNIFVSFLTKLSTGYWHLFDPLNGYTAISREALSRLPLERIRRDYSFECDLLVWLNAYRVRARDVPVPAVYGDEVSAIRLPRASIGLLRALHRGFWRRMLVKYVLWSFAPVALLLFGGLALLAIGTAIGVFVLVNSIGPPVASTATVLLSVGPLMLGVQFLVLALVLDILEEPR